MKVTTKHGFFLAILAAGLYALSSPFSKLLLDHMHAVRSYHDQRLLCRSAIHRRIPFAYDLPRDPRASVHSSSHSDDHRRMAFLTGQASQRSFFKKIDLCMLLSNDKSRAAKTVLPYRSN